MGFDPEKKEQAPAGDTVATANSPAEAVKDEGGAFKAYLVRARQPADNPVA